MAESPEAASGVPPLSPPQNTGSAGSKPGLLLAVAGIVGVLVWIFPLFHIVRLSQAGEMTATPVGATFAAASAALRIWKTDLPAAAKTAPELKTFADQLRADPRAARKKYAKAAGLGTAYFFIRGGGRITAVDRNYASVALDGTTNAVVALRIGPVFGNTVRDGCGLLEVNSFPGLQEFNALAAELDALVEKNVLPVLRQKAVVGARVDFAGCAEAPETAPGPGEPLLTVVPVEAEVR